MRHVSRLRQPEVTRRALIFAALKSNAHATVIDPRTGKPTRGLVASVTCPSGMTLLNVATQRSQCTSLASQSVLASGRPASGTIEAAWQAEPRNLGATSGSSLDLLGVSMKRQQRQVEAKAEQDLLRAKHLPKMLQASTRPAGMTHVTARQALDTSAAASDKQVDTSRCGALGAAQHAWLASLPVPTLVHRVPVRIGLGAHATITGHEDNDEHSNAVELLCRGRHAPANVQCDGVMIQCFMCLAGLHRCIRFPTRTVMKHYHS